MDDSLLVRVAERARHGLNDADHLANGELCFAVQPLSQRSTLYVGHCVVEVTASLTGIVQRENVRMTQPGADLDFTEEAIGPENGAELGPEDLEGDLPVKLEILDQIHRSHAAAAELPEQPIPL